MCLISPRVWVLVLLCWILSCVYRVKLITISEVRSLSSTFLRVAQSRTETHHVYSFTKIINKVNIGFCFFVLFFLFFFVQVVTVYLMFAWVGEIPDIISKFLSTFSDYSVFFTGIGLSSTKEEMRRRIFCELLFSRRELRVFWVLLSRVPPPLVRWAPFEVLRYQNRANSSKWNVGDYSYTYWDTGKNHRWTEETKKKKKRWE